MRLKLIHGWRVERFGHYLSVERTPGQWTAVKSSRELLPHEHDALLREEFYFKHPLNRPLIQLDAVLTDDNA